MKNSKHKQQQDVIQQLHKKPYIENPIDTEKQYEQVIIRHFYKPEIKVSYKMKNKMLERKVAEKSKQIKKQMNQQKIQQFLTQNNLNTLLKSYDFDASEVPANSNIPDKMKKAFKRINSAKTE